MPYNLLTLFNYLCFTCIATWETSIDGSIFFNLYYLYCLSIFQRTCCFRFKSGCKGKRFYFNCQTFWEVFFVFSFQLVSQALLRKGKNNHKRKKKQNRFLCESDCKDKNFYLFIPNFFGTFFVFIVKRSCAFYTKSFYQGFLLLESGCKSTPFSYMLQIYSALFSNYFSMFMLTR